MNNGIDFGTVANNASVHHQFIDFIFIIKGDFIWVKIIKHLIKPLSLSQNGNPAQTRLHTLKTQKGKECFVIVNDFTPFSIVIGLV